MEISIRADDEQVLTVLAKLTHDAETINDKFEELFSFFEYYKTYVIQTDEAEDYYKWWEENKFDGYSTGLVNNDYNNNWQNTKVTGSKVTLDTLRKSYQIAKEKVVMVR